MTGTALPVSLVVEPECKYDFGECPVGEHVDALCTLRNECGSMPVSYQFRRVAHFTSKPSSGKILAGQSQDVIFSFAPNQVGELFVYLTYWTYFATLLLWAEFIIVTYLELNACKEKSSSPLEETL